MERIGSPCLLAKKEARTFAWWRKHRDGTAYEKSVLAVALFSILFRFGAVSVMFVTNQHAQRSWIRTQNQRSKT
jgi:hypothetical protein